MPLSYRSSDMSFFSAIRIRAAFNVLPLLSATWKEKEGFLTENPRGFFK